MNLKNKTIFITGGSSGIGLKLVEAFLNVGSHVMICGRNEEKLKAVKKSYPSIEVFVCDVGNLTELGNLIKQIGDRIDIWVNNAGIFQKSLIVNETETFQKLQNELNINFVAPAFVISLLLPFMQKKPEAAIVNITSVLAIIPSYLHPMYSASKAAFHSYTESLKFQLQYTRTLLLEVIPPLVDTEAVADIKTNKMAPEKVAQDIVKALEQGKHVLKPGMTKFLSFMNWLLPKTTSGMINIGAKKELK